MTKENIRNVSMKPVFAEQDVDSTHLLIRIDGDKTYSNPGDKEKLISKYPFYYHFPIKMPILHEDPYYHGGTELIEEDRIEALTLHQNYSFTMCLNSKKSFIVRDRNQEGYSINPEGIETLTLSRSLPGLKSDYADIYVRHFEFYGEQLLALEKYNKDRKIKWEEEMGKMECTLKDGIKTTWGEITKDRIDLEIPNGIACERFRLLRIKQIGVSELETALRECGLLIAES